MRRSPLATYLVSAFAIGWVCFGLAIAVGRGLLPLPLPPTAFVVLGTLGPAIAGVLATARAGGRAALRELAGRTLRWRVRPAWYVVALLGPAVWIVLTAVLRSVFTGDQWPAFMPTSERLQLPIVIAVFFVPGLSEEVGWRGVALEQVRPRMALLPASLLIGLIHSAWHAPLWLIPGFGFESLPFPLYAAQVMALGVLFAWIYVGAGDSVLLAGLAHGAVNAYANVWGGALSARPGGVQGLEVALPTTIALVILAFVVALFMLADPRLRRDYERQPIPSLAAPTSVSHSSTGEA